VLEWTGCVLARRLLDLQQRSEVIAFLLQRITLCDELLDWWHGESGATQKLVYGGFGH
jgi:hypothetical protein